MFVSNFLGLIMFSGKSKTIASVAVILLAIANGWHFGVIQIYAWSTMAWNNSESMAYSEAIGKALDGSEVCGICQIVIQAEDSEENEDFKVIEFASKPPLILLVAHSPIIKDSVCSKRIALEPHRLTAWSPETQSPPPKGAIII